MKTVKPSVEIMHVTPYAYRLIEAAGRTCYKSEGKASAESAPAFCASIIKRGHLSVLEHATATVRFICDRGVTHELVRHRLAAYSQESTRYCNYGTAGEIMAIEPPGLSEYQRSVWLGALVQAERAYLLLIASGAPPQIARSVLPTCLKTEIVVTANFREWLHIFSLRTAPQAHPQIQEVMNQARRLLAEQYPVIFAK